MPENIVDYTLEKEKKTVTDKKIEAKQIPVYMERYEFVSDEDKQRCIKESEDELKAIQAERDEDNFDDLIDALECQYKGEIREDVRRNFNLNKNVTKVKVDKIVESMMQAFFESDPVFSITPRPEFFKEGYDMKVCEKQTDYLDYKMDNLPFMPAMELTFLSSVKLGTGILKIPYVIRKENRRREERYAPMLAVGKDPQTGEDVPINTGLRDFLANWPDAEKDYPDLVKQISDGKDISLIAEYEEVTYNDPEPKNVELKNFYVRRGTNGYEGLKRTRLIAELQTYTYWELKQEENNEKFYDIDKLLIGDKAKDEKDKEADMTEEFEVWEKVFYFKSKETDKDYTKIVFWEAKEKKIIIGSILYPYYAVDCYYLPFYVSLKKSGFYQPGVAENITDAHLVETAILNMTLDSMYQKNIITPITTSPKVQAQFLEKRFTHGIPIEAAPGEIDFLQKYMGNIDVGGLIMLMQYIMQYEDDVTKVSSLQSGRETAFDPTAPAAKTIALLKMSGLGMKDYVNHLIPSFNEVGYILLNLYYQMSKEGRQYAPRGNMQAVAGGDMFQTLDRREMIARTNLQAKAFSFDFDKQNEKQMDLALLQILRAEPLIANNPNAIYYLLKTIIENWSTKWKNMSEKIIPSLEDFEKMKLQTAVEGVKLFVQGTIAEAQTTGLPPKYDVQALIPIIGQLESQLVTPPPKMAGVK
jgi:hypothetical protein